MATSESDDFESADEEMNHDKFSKTSNRRWCSPTAIDSESDDDAECMSQTPYTNMMHNKKNELYSSRTRMATEKRTFKGATKKNEDSIKNAPSNDKVKSTADTEGISEPVNEKVVSTAKEVECLQTDARFTDSNVTKCDKEVSLKKTNTNNTIKAVDTTTNINRTNVSEGREKVLHTESSIANELSELEMPEEMKSNKKFKEVFNPEGWEGLGNEIELPEELTEEKLQPILKRLSLAGQQETDNASIGWGWGSWGVSSLINTASAGVSTLTNHVSHGLMLLEESMAVPEEPRPTKMEVKENETNVSDNKMEQIEEQSSFGFGNLLSGVSSITKLVESTGSKVMIGGLDTLEAIGKKTMEVLQDGDPGLKKKRAFFVNEMDKPILSQILREAKEKAETMEKTIEEREQMRKVHFESLFDDYQGLVHLEALEMLSKQSNLKIQQHLMGLDTPELNSVQETLEEVMELCDLGEDDEKEEVDNENNLKFRLQEACNDLGISITYDKLHGICEDSKTYFTPSATLSDQEIYEHAISILAQFTAFSVERFHKTAELLLIKEHRSTVNEADGLVHLTHILSNQIGLLANTYCSSLNTVSETADKPDKIKANITTIFMEASNASSYVQDAFKLLIPIVQVGAI